MVDSFRGKVLQSIEFGDDLGFLKVDVEFFALKKLYWKKNNEDSVMLNFL